MEELPGHCRIRPGHDLEFGSILCGGSEGVVTVTAAGDRWTQGGTALGAKRGRGGGLLAFEGPDAQGFNVRLEPGSVPARNVRGDLLQVGEFHLGVGNGALGLGAAARIPPGQPAGHYVGQCSLLVLFH